MKEIRFDALKRPLPSEELLDWRASFLGALAVAEIPSNPKDASPSGLSPGNSKTGATGGRFATGFVWNLPAIVTCPGASTWCKRHCYTADARTDIFPISEWIENLVWFHWNPSELSRRILHQLDVAPAPSAVRIHSSGDFFSAGYVEFWRQIIETRPAVQFWAYTRSWAVHDLLPHLERLRALENIELFASVDETTPTPPTAWRRSNVLAQPTPTSQSRIAIACPEQVGKAKNCLSCGYCLDRSQVGDILFSMH